MKIYDIQSLRVVEDPYDGGWDSGRLYLSKSHAIAAMKAAIESKKDNIVKYFTMLSEKNGSKKGYYSVLAEQAKANAEIEFRLVERETVD